MTSLKKIFSGPAGRPYQAGDLYSFRTSPATEFSPPETGRYGVLKILGFKENYFAKDHICIAVLDGIFDRHPSLSDVEALPVISNVRLYWRGQPACYFAETDSDNPLEDLKYIGSTVISNADAKLLAECRERTGWIRATIVAEGEWRWKHDQVAYKEENRRHREALEARIAAKRARQKNRLKTLTWDMLLAEKPFSRWDRHPPFPPPEFVEAATAQIHATVRALQALGPKPRRPQVREALKSCVDWFNVKDAEFGNVIETEEREDIFAVLEEMAYVAGQKALVSEIDDWREW
jgi:hypothetical protein